MKKLERAKANIDIINLIEYMTWKKVTTLRNNKCFLPDHKDKTGSCKVYKNTNSFYCWWCHRWWDIVNFVEYYTWCTRLDAIKKIINFNE
jgi:DNA primase